MNLLLQLRKICNHTYLMPDAAPEPYEVPRFAVLCCALPCCAVLCCFMLFLLFSALFCTDVTLCPRAIIISSSSRWSLAAGIYSPAHFILSTSRLWLSSLLIG